MKRASSALGAASARSAAAENKPTASGTSTAAAGKPATRRRPALGEIGAGTNATKGDKGKAAEPRRPLSTREQSQTAIRRTTRSTTNLEARGEDKSVAVKRKAASSSTTTTATNTLRTTRPGFSRNASAVSLGSNSTSTSTTTRPSRQLKETASITEDGPVAKRPRPSTPEDVFVEDNYDADHKELEVDVEEPSSKRTRSKDFGWTDLDAEDEGDPTMVSEYVVDAFKYMMELEVSRLVLSLSRIKLIARKQPFPTQHTWTSRTNFSGRCARY